MAYGLKQYWDELAADLKRSDDFSTWSYKKEEKITDEDEQSYQKQKIVLKAMLQIGYEIENTSDIYVSYKKAKGIEMDGLALKHFGSDEIPEIKGPKSLAFAKNIYLPHTKRLQNVYFSDFILWIAGLIGIDIKKRINHAKQQAKDLEMRVNHLIQTDEKHSLPTNIKDENRLEDLEEEIQQAKITLERLKKRRADLELFSAIIANNELEKEASLRAIIAPEDKTSSIQKIISDSPLNEISKQILLKHESHNVPLWKQGFYKPILILKQCLQDEINELPQINECIAQTSKKIETKHAKLIMLDNKMKLASIQAEQKQKLAEKKNSDDKILQYYKEALAFYLNNIKQRTTKQILVQITEDNLKNNVYSTVDRIKLEIAAIREIVSRHADTGIVGFFKCTWARNTFSLNELNKVFDDKNNIIRKC